MPVRVRGGLGGYGDGQVAYPMAALERIIPHFIDTVGDLQRREHIPAEIPGGQPVISTRRRGVVVIESQTRPYHLQGPEVRAAFECGHLRIDDGVQSYGDGQMREVGAVPERSVSEAADTRRDGDIGHGGTTAELLISDTGHTAGDIYGLQRGALVEGVICDGSHLRFPECNRCEVYAIAERLLTDMLQTAAEADPGEPAAVVERFVLHAF